MYKFGFEGPNYFQAFESKENQLIPSWRILIRLAQTRENCLASFFAADRKAIDVC